MARLGEHVLNTEAQLYSSLFNKAVEFYSTTQSGSEGQQIRLRISQEMAIETLKLALPQIQKMSCGCTSVLDILPLRGGLGLGTLPILDFFQARVEPQVIPVALGIKRNTQTMTTEVYHQTRPADFDPAKTSVVMFDWGTATGMTFKRAALELHELGIPFERMMAISMTLPEEGERSITAACPGLIQAPATRARMNEKSYISEIAPRGSDQFTPVTPTDWGDGMFGMEDGSPKITVMSEILRFCRLYSQIFKRYYPPEKVIDGARQLLKHYGQKHVDRDLSLMVHHII